MNGTGHMGVLAQATTTIKAMPEFQVKPESSALSPRSVTDDVVNKHAMMSGRGAHGSTKAGHSGEAEIPVDHALLESSSDDEEKYEFDDEDEEGDDANAEYGSEALLGASAPGEWSQQQQQHEEQEQQALAAPVKQQQRDADFEDAAFEEEDIISMEEVEESLEDFIRESSLSVLRPEDTVILMDYDDTLLASSWLASRQLGLNSSEDEIAVHAEELRVVEACAAKLLSKSLELGDVHLVTNAEEGWIQLTVDKFMPALRPLLPHVSIISARSTFEAFHPSCPRTWKVMAFRQQIYLSMQGSQPKGKINIISIGDSHHEREALKIVSAEIPNAYSKAVKFIERPGLDLLQKQMEMVHSCFEYICEYHGNLDIMLAQMLQQQQQQLQQQQQI